MSFAQAKEIIESMRINESMKISHSEISMNINESMSKVHRVEKHVEKSERVAVVDGIAERLVRKFNAPQSRAFFQKCGWHLSQAFIESTVEASNRPQIHAPLKYFVKACANEMLNQTK